MAMADLMEIAEAIGEAEAEPEAEPMMANSSMTSGDLAAMAQMEDLLPTLLQIFLTVRLSKSFPPLPLSLQYHHCHWHHCIALQCIVICHFHCHYYHHYHWHH